MLSLLVDLEISIRTLRETNYPRIKGVKQIDNLPALAVRPLGIRLPWTQNWSRMVGGSEASGEQIQFDKSD